MVHRAPMTRPAIWAGVTLFEAAVSLLCTPLSLLSLLLLLLSEFEALVSSRGPAPAAGVQVGNADTVVRVCKMRMSNVKSTLEIEVEDITNWW